MGRSTIVGEVLLFACFVVLVKIPEITTATTARAPYAKDGFLAGEETPVWVAKLNGRKVVYTRIQTPIVLESVNYWNSMKQNEASSMSLQKECFSISIERWSDYNEYFDSKEELQASRKRSSYKDEVRYPSILVVMHYDNMHPPSNRNHWLLEDRILYALAFWGTVDSSLRVIQNPRVSLRITGIIIVEKRQASPYLAWNDGERSFGGSLCSMMDYWTSLANENSDFEIGSYDIVAHMTNVKPRPDNDECSNLYVLNPVVLAVGTQGPVCSRENEIGGVIVHDDFAFDGLGRAIGQISKVLGGNEEAQRGWGRPRKNWHEETLNHISKALAHASCMSEPKEYHPPGRPVAPILAGELMPSEKQCEVFGYGLNAKTCWNSRRDNKRSSCKYLFCAEENAAEVSCWAAGLTLDGTLCNGEQTKICLDGECVDKPYP